MKSTQNSRRNSHFHENAHAEPVAIIVIGGATWSTTCTDKVHRSIVYDLGLNPLNVVGEIAFGAKSHLKTVNGRKISNMTGGATWSTTFMHTHMGDIVYKIE